MKNPRIYTRGIVINVEKLKHIYQDQDLKIHNADDFIQKLQYFIDNDVIWQCGDPY